MTTNESVLAGFIEDPYATGRFENLGNQGLPDDVYNELLRVAADKHVSVYYLAAIYKRGQADALASEDDGGSYLWARCYACGHRLAYASDGCPQCGIHFADGDDPPNWPEKCECDRCKEARMSMPTDPSAPTTESICTKCGERFHDGACCCDPSAPPLPTLEEIDALGLNIDMLDADRLRDWARNIEDGGLLITAWASPSFLVQRLRDMADRVEKEVREVGQLRSLLGFSAPYLSDVEWNRRNRLPAIVKAYELL